MQMANEGVCLNIQQELLATATQLNPNVVRSRYGFLQSLIDPANRRGVGQQIAFPDGKNKTVQVLYTERVTEDYVTDTPPASFCDATRELFQKEQLVTVSEYVGTPFRVTIGANRDICNKTVVAKLAEDVRLHLDALNQKLDKRLIDKAVANSGNWADGSALKQFQVYDTTNKAAVYEGEALLLQAIESMGVGFGSPIVVAGSGNMDMYRRLVRIGCCNDAGIQMGQAGSFAYFYDPNLANRIAYTAANGMIVYLPGAMQMIERQMNVGQYAWSFQEAGARAGSEAGTIVDPETGVQWDIDLVWVACDKEWQITIGKHFDLWNMPNAYGSGDPLQDVNFTFLAEATAA